MRRLSAMVVLALVGFWLISPALSTGSDSNLPACCRKAGTHHCAMDGAGDGVSSGQVVTHSRCAWFPGSFANLRGLGALISAFSLSIFALVVMRAVGRYAARTRGLMCLNGPHRKRGPPVLLSFAH